MLSIIGLGFLAIAGVFAVSIAMALRGGDGRFTLGRVIGDAGRAIGRAPGLFAAIALTTAGVPLLLGLGASFGDRSMAGMALVVPGGLAVLIFDLAWYQLGTLAMIAATLAALDGRVEPGAVLRDAIPAVPSAMLASALYWLAVGTGFVFFVVPGAIAACVWMLVLPAIVAERLGPFAALARSAALTRGIRWHLFLLAVIGFAFGAGAQFALGIVAGLVGAGAGAMAAIAFGTGLLSVFPPVLVAVAYRAAVERRDGPATGELARIFA